MLGVHGDKNMTAKGKLSTSALQSENESDHEHLGPRLTLKRKALYQ